MQLWFRGVYGSGEDSSQRNAEGLKSNVCARIIAVMIVLVVIIPIVIVAITIK